MICFKDMTFCSAVCANIHCYRQFTEQQRESSRRWWSHDPDNAPIALSDFSDVCEDYRP